MLTNQYGWRFNLAGDCLEVFIPEHKQDELNYPLDVPYHVLRFDQQVSVAEAKRVMQSSPEYS